MIARMSDRSCTVFYLLEKGEMKMAPSPLMPRKERTGGAARRANSLRLKRGSWKICYRVSVIPFIMKCYIYPYISERIIP